MYAELATDQSDIIASVLALVLLVSAITLVVVAFLAGRLLKSAATISLFPAPTGLVTSGQPVPVTVQLGPVRIPPLFRLQVQLVFSHEDRARVLTDFAGLSRTARTMNIFATFPHRGLWLVTGVYWTLSDVLGITVFSWRTDAPETAQSITVYPPLANSAGVPVIASSYREGDSISHPIDHHGDYYDIKRYHPSDGMNKLLWKLFARSGDLLSRKPEESVSPEGQTVAFCLATRADDPLAAAFVRYLEQAESNDTAIIASCLGGSDAPLARSATQMQELLVAAAFNVPERLEDRMVRGDMEAFLSRAKGLLEVSRLANVLIFVSPALLSSALYAGYLKNIGTMVATEGAVPIFCYLAQSGVANTPVGRALQAPFIEKALALCYEPGERSRRSDNYQQYFKDTCHQRGWQVLEGTIV